MVVSPCYVLLVSTGRTDLGAGQLPHRVSKTYREGLTPRPFLFSDGRIHRISIRKVMKSGASRISKNICLFPVVRWGDGRDVRAVTERGTALSPRPDHLRLNREGSGTMPCCKRVSERLRRESAHYAIRTAFLSLEKHVRVRRPCVSPDRGPEKVGASAIPEIWEGKHRGMRFRIPREGRSFTYYLSESRQSIYPECGGDASRL